MPRYVILTHDHPFLHWDLMLEKGGSLETWRLLQQPDSGASIVAEALGDHRLHYLDYEGPVSQGRGRVERWDGGTYRVLNDDATRREVELSGERLNGRFLLERQPDRQWSFQSRPD